VDQLATGVVLQHGVGVGLAQDHKLLGRERQTLWQQQRRQGIGGCCQRDGHEATLI
jgi:hypothetical protein